MEQRREADEVVVRVVSAGRAVGAGEFDRPGNVGYIKQVGGSSRRWSFYRATDMETAAKAARSATGSPQFVGFELAGQKYAFRIERIQEIVIPTGVTRIPEVPRYVDGVSNLRGTIIPIINLRVLFGLDPREADAEARTVVVNVGSRTMGCSVDSVSRVMRVAADQIQPAPDAVMASGRRYIDGFARVSDELFILLDVDQLLDPANLEEVHRASLLAAQDSRPPGGDN
jgi:purine-binding chemotaxis protein CheW